MTENTYRNWEKIHDRPIRNCMMRAVESINQNRLVQASKEIYEALAAFKFKLVEFFADFRVTDVKFKKMGFKIDFPNLLADLAIKIIFGGDEQAFKLLMAIGSDFRVLPDGRIRTGSRYIFPQFESKSEAWSHYHTVLRIVLSYQDRIPRSQWRQ